MAELIFLYQFKAGLSKLPPLLASDQGTSQAANGLDESGVA